MSDVITNHWPISALVGLVIFLLGRFWEASSRIHAMRQQAYADFLGNCASVYEFMMLDTLEDHWKLLSSLRKGAANLGLYASPRVDSMTGQYLGMVAEIVAIDRTDTNKFTGAITTLEKHYSALSDAMRKDALGWTYFGFLDRFQRRKQSHTTWVKRK